MKRVAVVILNWNGEKFLRQFLPGVVQHSESLADVVVIDNASTDQSLSILRNEFPSVEIANSLWHSEDYSKAREIRQRAATTKMIILDGV